MSQHIIDKFQAEQGWTDKTVLDLLIQYISNQQSDDALEDFLSEAAAPPDDPLEGVDLSKPPSCYEYWSVDEVSECAAGIDDRTTRELWDALHESVQAGTAKPMGGDTCTPSSPGKIGTTEEPIVSNGQYGTDLVAAWPKLSEHARKNIHRAAIEEEARLAHLGG